MADSSDDVSDDDFGQKLPPLHIYLKRVLDKYPEGGQILKELVQNADDAGAKKVVFLFDKSEHSKEQLWKPELEEFQGPALYAYNDAVFQKADWYNIQHPEQSGKADELTKVGRFGLGFISVYHLTDLPCILSGRRIGFLDPLERHFIFDPHTKTHYKEKRGKKWRLNGKLLTDFRGQFSPFLLDLFHCDQSSFESGEFDGTIFRFPLRTKVSEISKSLFSDEHRVSKLFHSFEADAELSLLFLKHVESIEVYERQNTLEQPKLIFKARISPEDCSNLTTKREEFLTKSLESKDFQILTCMQIEKQQQRHDLVSNCTSSYITINAIKKEHISRPLQELISDEDLKLMPWMGIAVPKGIPAQPTGVCKNYGRVFCFLPLPTSEETGLPVHVHGYFGLGDNRRSIKWPDRESQHDKNALWNKLLVAEVFPEVYKKVILASIDKSKEKNDVMSPEDVYGAWPCTASVNKEWSDGVKSFLQMMRNEAIFYTDHNGGCWMKAHEVYVDTQDNPLLTKVLKQKGNPVAQLPSHVTESLSWAGVEYKALTPSIVRSCIRNDPLQFLSREEKLKLLQYVISDNVSDLANLHLLPLQNGTFTSFCKRSPTVYIASSQNPTTLIPNGETKFAANDLPAVLKSNQVMSYTQLKSLHADDIVPLLQQTLPSSWIRSTNAKVQWTPGYNQHPTIQWLTEIWNWLTKNQISLMKFLGIPLIPMTNNSYITKLQQNSIIFRKDQGFTSTCLTENVCSFLEAVGAIVVRDDLPSFITEYPHLNSFIQVPTPEGVLNILDAYKQKVNLQSCVANMASCGKDELRSLFGHLQQVTHGQQDILKQLQLFLSNEHTYVSVRQCMTAVPSNFFEIPVKRLKYVRLILRDRFDNNLASLLGIRNESAVDLLSKNILLGVADGFYNASDSTVILSWVLERSQYDGLLHNLKFIPTTMTTDHQLASASELFEPDSQLLMLFRSKNVFPQNPYSQGRLLNQLKRVGLKNESHVTCMDVLNVAKEVSATQSNGQADVERARVLIQHINRYPHLLSEGITSDRITKALYKFLEDLFWVPCEGSPPSHYPVSAGWCGKSDALYSPRQVGLIETAMLQGAVLPLINMPGINQELLRIFKWSAQLDFSNYQKVELVVLQLKNIVDSFVFPQGLPAVHNAVHEIYGFLSKASEKQLKHLFAEHMNASQPWVWHGSGFTTPDKMALNVGTFSINLAPYLYIVPESIVIYRDFLSRLGVQQHFQESALTVVLSNVQEKYARGHHFNAETIESDTNLVCSILGYLTRLSNFDSKSSNVLVPCRSFKTNDTCLYMSLASECLYVDEERLMSQLFDEDVQEDFDKRIIHELVSNDLARHLGVQPLSLVVAPSEAMVDLGYERAGPHETTVNAIKRNLDMYKEGVDIFKELIQNADDAGATEVKFLIDWRRNEETANNLLSDGMKACHGPSIWAFNNAQFSKEDITNVCSIAAQSKKHQLDKVGRFGLGFTSVYHLTDVPSVVSGPYVLICDPRTTHLGSRVVPGQPGIKLDLTDNRHRRTLRAYPNQFQPYNGIFGCDLQTSTKGYDHTLIRLPLRTNVEASQQFNLLSGCVHDSKVKVKPLVEALKKALDTLLLFTQNVVHVSVQELESKNLDDVQTVMSVTVERVQQMPRSISGQEGNMSTERNLLKATADCMKDSRKPIPETTMIVKVTHETCAVGNPSKGRLKTKHSHFIISSCMETGEVLELAKTGDGVQAGILPCGGVAAELVAGIGGLTPKPVEGRAFSYLPLEVSTGLPFHVNGNFLLQPNRRQLWSKPSSSTGEFEARWNICFIHSVLCHALFNLLKDLQLLHNQNRVDARDFQSLWPRHNTCASDFLSFVDQFYHTLGSEGDAPAVILNGSQWVSVHECFFTKWTLTDSEDLKSSIITVLRENLSPQCWVELDPDVVSSIAQVGASNYFDINTFSVGQFIQKVFFARLEDSTIASTHRDCIVLYLLDLRIGERRITDYDGILKTTDCIPCSPDGEHLVSPDRLVHPFTLVGSLYSEDDHRFPYGEEYRKETRLLSLRDLGMARDDLPWEDLCERAESIGKDNSHEQKSTNLLKVIDEKLRKEDQPTCEQQKRIQKAEFLPLLTRPKGYPSKWYKSDLEFMSAIFLYGSKHKDLIGSVQPLLDETRLGSEAMNPRVIDFLGFSEKNVKVSDVIEQLDILIEEEVTHQTSAMASRVYSFLHDKICKDVIEENDLRKLCTLKFVLCEGEFRECKQFAFNFSGKSGPYLFEVPKVLCHLKKLLSFCGVKEHFEMRDYLQTLQHLKNEFKDKPLTEVAVRTAEGMTSEIVLMCHSDSMKDKNLLELQDQEMYVLDDHCILRKPSELVYHDMRWVDKSINEVYTHTSVTHHAADIIGIKTTKQKNLESYSSSSGFEMEFGQNEKLTDRLSNILAAYPTVSDVFKELLQNADDAGATEIHFVYDPRKHKSEKVISKNWADVQSLPALCVYNDKSFTEADIKGIQKVGIGGKRDDVATTGRFGIGFNAVYHLTDCPSFLSNKDTLCVFDPLLKYTERARRESPGRMYKTSNDFRQNFPDMLCGYLEDEFKGLEGTMFRFPLRANPSEISQTCFRYGKFDQLLEDFMWVSEESLLFLNNIKKITISRICEQTNKLEQKYSIKALLLEEDEQHRTKLSDHLKLYKKNPLEPIPPLCHVYSLMTQDSTGRKEKWLVSQMLGFEEDFAVGQAPQKQLPRGGVAALLSSKRMWNDQHQYKAYCVLPLPIYTHLPVHVNGMFELNQSRRDLSKSDEYMSGRTADKNSLNNSTNDLSKGDDYATRGRSLIHKWNHHLITNVIAPAYAELLMKAGRKIVAENEDNEDPLPIKNCIRLYDGLFPKDLKNVHGEWQLLAKATLCYISQKNLTLLPVVRPKQKGTEITWHHVNSVTSSAYFDDLNLKDVHIVAGAASSAAKKESTPSTSSIIRTLLLRVGFNLLESSIELCQAFQACDVKAEFVSPQAVVRHLSSNPIIEPRSSSVPLKDTAFEDMTTFHTLFKYCLEGITQPIELNGLPLRLTNDNMLSEFTTVDVLYVTSHCNVLPCLKHVFLHSKLVHLCNGWLRKNDIEEEAYTSGVFKQFTVFEFALHVGKHLPEEWLGCTRHIDWTPNKNGHPSEKWLKHLWEFICSEVTDENIQSCLKPIEDWPLFPTTSGKLVPPVLSQTLLYLHDDYRDSDVRKELAKVLKKLGVPEVSVKHMPLQSTTSTRLLKNYLALPARPENVVNVIEFLLKTGGKIENLSLSEGKTLLQYFQEGCESFSEENIQIIKMLSIFKLLDNTMTSLHNYQHYHTIEDYEVLNLEAKTWMENMRCVFLPPCRPLTLIYDELGISSITHADIYLKFVLPSFDMLSLEAKVKHLKYIEDKVLPLASEDAQKAILESLSQTAFIPDGTNTLKTAEHFFDPDNDVFKAMVDPNKLLPESMKPLIYFLSKVGLHIEVTQELFVRFAKTIETRAKAETNSSQLEELFANSKLLTKELHFNNSLYDPTFLREISKIKFIPSVPIKKELTDIHPAFSDTEGRDIAAFIAYQGSVPEMYLELVWTVAKVLPDWAIPSETETHVITRDEVKMHDCLGIQTKMVIDKALSHIQNVCGRMEKKNAIHKKDTMHPDVRETFNDVMRNICSYLQENIQEHGDECKRRLQDTPICLVEEGKVLIRAAHLVFEMNRYYENMLRPYLYKAPRELSDFDALFRFLGAQESYSFEQMAGVLSAIQRECKGERLGPNESKTVRSAVTALFKVLINMKENCKTSVSKLYLPNSKNILRRSSDLYYANPHLMDQAKLVSNDKEFILPLKQCGFDVKDEMRLIELLPEPLRPRNLGNEMHASVQESNEDCPPGKNCPLLEHIKRMVNSVEMTRVILRLLQHQLQDKPVDADTTELVKQLQCFGNFSCKVELNIGLFDLKGNLLARRSYSAAAFFDKSCIYLEHSWPLKGGLVFEQIAECCNVVIGGLLDYKHLGRLRTALQCPSPNDMNVTLSKARIPEYDTTTQGLQPDEHRPGTIVPRDIRHFFDQDPCNLFHEEDIVGYERSLDDPVDNTALCPEEHEEGLPLEADPSSDGTTELIYASIVEHIGENDGSARLSGQYKIDIGLSEHITVSVTSLYKFLRPKEKSDMTVVPFTGDPEALLTSSDECQSEILKQDRDNIKEVLREAFQLPEEERRRVVHRLYRKWHPDKNPGQERRANEAFKFLRAEIERLDSSSRYSKHYSRWDAEASRDSEEARNYQEKSYARQKKASENKSANFVPPSFSKETPDPRSARLWFRQAEEHFRVAGQTTHIQWIAFQVHQAAEVALKATQYSLTGYPDTESNDLLSLARTVCQHRDVSSRELLTKVCELIRLDCDFTKPRHPQACSSQTSGQAYQEFNADSALQICRELLDLVRDIIGITVF